jgi:hypothetical protein
MIKIVAFRNCKNTPIVQREVSWLYEKRI